MKVSGGQKAVAALRKLSDKLSHPATLRVGFLEGATYPGGTPVALIAAIHNFGAPAAGIPPRPFFDEFVADYEGSWPKAIRDALKAHDYDVDVALGIVGELMRGQLQQTITEFEGVPLKPATVARKGFEKQLIDTSHMLNSVDYEVR